MDWSRHQPAGHHAYHIYKSFPKIFSKKTPMTIWEGGTENWATPNHPKSVDNSGTTSLRKSSIMVSGGSEGAFGPGKSPRLSV